MSKDKALFNYLLFRNLANEGVLSTIFFGCPVEQGLGADSTLGWKQGGL